MPLLSVTDVRDRHHRTALAQLEHVPGLHEQFERELMERSPDRQRLFYDEAEGWCFLDVCDLCDAELGLSSEAPALAGLCEACEQSQPDEVPADRGAHHAS